MELDLVMIYFQKQIYPPLLFIFLILNWEGGTAQKYFDDTENCASR